MFSYFASLGIVFGLFIGVLFVVMANIGLARAQKATSQAPVSQVKMAALMLLGVMVFSAGIIIWKAKEIAWAGEIVFLVVGLVILWRTRYVIEQHLKFFWALAGLFLLVPPLHWLWYLI